MLYEVITVFEIVDEPIVRFLSFVGHEPVDSGKAYFSEIFQNQLKGSLGVEQISNLLGTIAGAFGGLLIGAFAVSFITFFFLKEDRITSYNVCYTKLLRDARKK